MLLFKSCPCCRGDLYLDKDRYGAFVLCIQCGYLKDPLAQELQKPKALASVLKPP